MGHTKVTTTIKHVHVDNDIKRDAVKRMDEQDEE